MQKLYNMEPISYDGNMFYPFFWGGETLCLPYNYKEYAKELIENFLDWKIKARTYAMHQYASELESAKARPDKVDKTFGVYGKLAPVHTKSYDEIYDNVVDSLLPDFVSCTEVAPYILTKAKESSLPTYHLDELLQLAYYADTNKEVDVTEGYEASI